MSSTAPTQIRQHLRAALMALAGVVLLLSVAMLSFQRIGDRHMSQLIVTPLKAKDQGERIQREAFLRDDVLPVVGSSELTLEVNNRAVDVFLSKPTGFQVCPIGRAGNTSLMMAHKIAALGDRIRGRKIALIFSASWFFRVGVPDDSYAGNFSPLQVLRLLQNEGLEDGLRRRFLSRLKDYPETLDLRPALGFYVRNAEAGGAWPAIQRAAIRPLIEVQRAKLSLEDLFATAGAVIRLPDLRNSPTMALQDMEWDRKINQMEDDEAKEAAADPNTNVAPLLLDNGVYDGPFLAEMNASIEWDDFGLLLDTLKSFGATAYLISVPLTGTGYDRRGVSRAARDKFYHRFESLCAEHGYQANTFSDHDRDDGFTIPKSSHFTPKGWLYVDRALDDFYHDRPNRKG